MALTDLRLSAAFALCSSALAPPVYAQIDKLATHETMRAIAAEQASMRGVFAERARYAALQAQFDALKASMGGDDPTLMYIGVQSHLAAAKSAKVVPPVPPGATPITLTFTQATPTAIPTGPAVVVATVTVSGMGTYAWDIDLTTNLTHTFAADLDITLQSPAGTVVTLTTDNGAGHDNVFNGTLWDDSANPAGQVPYTTNNGVVSDHAYVNLTTAAALVPEEALGAFIGENPNGTWTVTISDDLAGDGGSLDAFSLAVTALASAPITTVVPTVTQSTPTPIPTTGPSVVTSTLNVAGAGTSITDIDLVTNLTHTFAADLDITLTSPAGTVVTLSTDNGASNDNTFNGTDWGDDGDPAGQVPYAANNGVATDHAYVNQTAATPLVAEEAMAAFQGEDPNGTWTVTVSDDLTNEGGSLDSWSLDIVTGTGASAPQFDYNPTPTSVVPFTTGAIGSTGNGSIAVTIGTPGSGSGAPAITTTTCTAPTEPFSGFGQAITAEGAAVSTTGGPLAGTCILGAAEVDQTLTCSENRGGAAIEVTFELTCPAGSVGAVTSAPSSGETLTLPTQSFGGPATSAPIHFINPNLVAIDVTCIAPAAPFSASPLEISVPPSGSALTTVSFNSPTAGTFIGALTCTAGPQTFNFGLRGSTLAPNVPVPTLAAKMRGLLALVTLLIGTLALGLLAGSARRIQ